LKKLSRDKCSPLFFHAVSDGEKKFYKTDTWRLFDRWLEAVHVVATVTVVTEKKLKKKTFLFLNIQKVFPNISSLPVPTQTLYLGIMRRKVFVFLAKFTSFKSFRNCFLKPIQRNNILVNAHSWPF